MRYPDSSTPAGSARGLPSTVSRASALVARSSRAPSWASTGCGAVGASSRRVPTTSRICDSVARPPVSTAAKAPRAPAGSRSISSRPAAAAWAIAVIRSRRKLSRSSATRARSAVTASRAVCSRWARSSAFRCRSSAAVRLRDRASRPARQKPATIGNPPARKPGPSTGSKNA